MKKNLKEIDNKEINEVVSLTKKILNLLYIVMIVAIILCGTIILKNLNVWNILLTFLKVLSPLFIGFVIAWLFNPLVKKLNKKGIPRIVGSILVYAVFLVFIYVFLRILVPTLNKTVIENGILKTYFYNLEEALIDNVKSTGNGTINGTKAGIDYSNITIKKGRLSEDELFNKIQNGLYITSIGGLHAGLNSSSGDFSLQAEGFAVINGKKDHLLGLFTISGNLFDLFNNIIAVGNNLELLVNSYEVPSIAFKNVNYSAS